MFFTTKIIQRMDSSIIDIVFTHGGCGDGSAASWLIWYEQRVEIVWVFDRNKMPDVNSIIDRNIVITDICFDYDTTMQILRLCKSLTLIDHHQTTKPVIEKIISSTNEFRNKFTFVMDERYCATQLVYMLLATTTHHEHSIINRICNDETYSSAFSSCVSVKYHESTSNCGAGDGKIKELVIAPNIDGEIPVSHKQFPWLIQVIAARDLWLFDAPDAESWWKPVSAAVHDMCNLNKFKYSEIFDSYNKQTGFESLIQYGKGIISEKTNLIKNFIKAGKKCIINVGYIHALYDENNPENTTENNNVHEEFPRFINTYLVECPRFLSSDVGSTIMQSYPDLDCVSCFSYDITNGCFYISNRTNKDTINLGKIFSKFPDGGGHPKAAGFTIFPELCDNCPMKYSWAIGIQMGSFFSETI